MPRVTPDPAVMVTDGSKPNIPQDSPAPVHSQTGSLGVAAVDFERQGPPGIKEPLGNYQRISVITFMLFMNCVLLGLCSACLLTVEISDIDWQRIIAGKNPFPVLKIPKSKTYFERTKLRDTPVGKLIYHRRDWIKDKVYFGMGRDSTVHLVQLTIMFVILFFCILHLVLACFFKRVRRCFQLISLGYGFVGLFVFTMCLTTLYFTFVHKVSSYLENALDPPNATHFEPPPVIDNTTIEQFVNVSFACAFAFSIPNRFAKDRYPYWPFPEDSSFEIDNITYSKSDLMELGICPRQDYLLVSVFLLAITSICCWMVASYSETIENHIIGPPVWLQRFKVKIHKGIRHWHTRNKIPSHLNVLKEGPNNEDNNKDDFPEQDSDHVDNEQHHHHPHHHHHHHGHQQVIEIVNPYDKDSPTWGDAYDVLDGGIDHILLTDPFNKRGASTQRLYRSFTSLPMLDK